MDQPNEEQLEALRRFAKRYGKDWKSELSVAWSTGTDAGAVNGDLLRQLRNQFGPRWLVDFKLEKK